MRKIFRTLVWLWNIEDNLGYIASERAFQKRQLATAIERLWYLEGEWDKLCSGKPSTFDIYNKRWNNPYKIARETIERAEREVDGLSGARVNC